MMTASPDQAMSSPAKTSQKNLGGPAGGKSEDGALGKKSTFA
jgi:hypothetical protein